MTPSARRFSRRGACGLAALPLIVALLVLQTFSEILVAQEEQQQGVDDHTIDDLRSSDEGKSALAGITILQEIIDRGPSAELYSEFVGKALDQSTWVGKPTRVQVARKLITAMEFLASRGERFENGPKLIVPLIGVGPEGLRREVREALISFIQYERAPLADEDPKTAKESRTFNELGEKLKTNSPPSQRQVSEIAAVLRRVDAPKLVDFLVEGMVINGKGDARARGARVYVLELRKMLYMDFASVQEWQDWWAAERSKPFQLIVEGALRDFAKRRVELWRKILARFKESRDPERYLRVLSDTLEDDFTTEMRVAVFRALAEFPGWLRDARFPTDGASSVGAMKAALLARGAELILGVFRGDADSREVKRAGLAALQRFNGFVLSNPDLETEVSAILAAELDSRLDPVATESVESEPERQEDLVQLLRTVGALRMTNKRIQEILKPIVESDDRPLTTEAEVAVVTEAVVALGRTLAQTKDTGVMRRFLVLYAKTRESQKKGARDLRRACVAALNVEVKDPKLRGEIRGLYIDILASNDDNPERIPAVVGLGILARAGDSASGDQLKKVLVNRSEYDVSEVNAVIDGLAYLDGQQAMTILLDFLTAKRTNSFDEQVWSKVVTILKAGGQDLSVWLLQRLEDRGFGADRDVASVIVRLAEEPDLKDIFSESKLNLEDPAIFNDFWRYENSQIHAFEILGRETDAMTRLKRLNDIVVKNEKEVSQLRPTVNMELETLKSRLDDKVAVKALFDKVPLPKDMLAQEVWKIFAPSIAKQPVVQWKGRWRDLNWLLHEIRALTASPEAVAFCKQFAQDLENSNKAVWKDVPAEFRVLYRKELNAALGRLQESEESDAG